MELCHEGWRAKTSSKSLGCDVFKNCAVERKLRKLETSTRRAPVHARSALVPLVVVMTMRRPRTASAVNSLGEFPTSGL